MYMYELTLYEYDDDRMRIRTCVNTTIAMYEYDYDDV